MQPMDFAAVHVHIHNNTATSSAEAQVDGVGARSDCKSPFSQRSICQLSTKASAEIAKSHSRSFFFFLQ